MQAILAIRSSSRAIRFTVLMLCCAIAAEAFAQDARREGVQYKRDGKDRVVALDYWGTAGLRRIVPQDISQLESVYISYGTKLSADDLAVLSTLENVRDLTLGGVVSAESVYIEGSLDKLTGMKRLRSLSFCKDQFRDEDLEFIAKLPQLEYFNLWADEYEKGSPITDGCAEFLRRAKTLRHIRIYDGGKLTDQFVNVISRDLPNLESLNFDSNQLTDKALEMLASRCPKLKQLQLRSKGFTDRGVRHLVAARNLECLWLESSLLTNASVESVKELTHLKELELTIPTIDDRGLRALANLSKLEILALRTPALTDEQFTLLAGHPSLQSGFLNGSKLTEAHVIAVIKSIPKLKHLEIGPDDSNLQVAVKRELLGR